MSIKSLSVLLALATVLLIVVPQQAATQPTSTRVTGYELIDLGTLGGESSGATALAENGTVVGWALDAAGKRHAFMSCNECAMQDLGFLPFGDDSAAAAISNNGQYIVGFSETQVCCQIISPDGPFNIPYQRKHRRATLWAGDTMESLGALYCHCTPSIRILTSEAHGVNDFGQVVGFSPVQAWNSDHVFHWQNGVLAELDGSPFYPLGHLAFDINNQGQIVGEFQDWTALENYNAFIWHSGVYELLPNLPLYDSSTAVAINAFGATVGWSYAVAQGSGSEGTATIWFEGEVESVGKLDGDQSSMALGINDGGQVVGWSGVAGNSRAFLWHNGMIMDLNSLLPRNSEWILTEAVDINNLGMIAGTGTRNGEMRAFLLKPPSAAASERLPVTPARGLQSLRPHRP
jgi:probable HAF family extracellular repeat protein